MHTLSTGCQTPLAALWAGKTDLDKRCGPQAILVRVFEQCAARWEVYDPLCEEFDALVACLRFWHSRARHKRDRRLQLEKDNSADAFR